MPIDVDLRKHILKLGPYQPEGNFQKDAKGRSLSSSYYSFISKAGQKIERKWLCYSTRLHVAYCQDELEKLAYQLYEEAELTERPIRRLSKVMYGSTCVDMQVDVMGECLSSIKHVVGHRFPTLETISNYRNSYPGFSIGRPRGTTPTDDRYIVLQARRNRWQTAGEITIHTTQVTGRPISRFTVARRLHGGGLFARRPVRCVPLTPAHRRRRSLWCREHRNWRDNEWGRVLFTDESRFSLSSDSHRILIWREQGSRNHPLEHH
ncbi:transposable element Tcb2 transposase [Trichonephila clavipes]|uniref:Transposable element Tcb2 transposase n=1 Tax=Trichonephila clavipes TaxID=2585209 RepID=A0A8X6RS33_TRICX|nr:transposable element Tcb2 transposase [Trichonephila clavipes]